MNNNFEINDWVKITMKNKSVICGQIAAFGKKLVEGEEHDFYQVRVLDDRETTVFDVQMQAIEKMYTNVELQDWVIEIAAKYGIYVGDNLDLRRKLANSVIGLAGHWAELSEDEKKIFGYFAANPSMVMAIMGMANTYMSCYMSTQADFIEYLIFIKKELDNGEFKFPVPFDNGTRLKDILENKVDEKYYISEEKVKKFIKNIHTYESNTSNEQHFIGNINRPDLGTGYAGGVWDKNNISHTLTTMQGGGRQPHIMTGIVSNCGEKFEKEIDVANTLLARDYKGFGNQGMNAVVEIPQATKKGYIECEVGGVADLSYPDSKTRRGRVQECGNISPTITATETGVCKIEYDDKIICASRGRNPENPSDCTPGAPTEQRLEFNHNGCKNTLTSVQKDNYVFETNNIRIRKLTPRECFRLMGFSDNAFNTAEEVVSNTQLYKQAALVISLQMKSW